MGRTIYEMLQDIIEWIGINDRIIIYQGFASKYNIIVEGLWIADDSLERAIRQVWSRLQTGKENEE